MSHTGEQALTGNPTLTSWLIGGSSTTEPRQPGKMCLVLTDLPHLYRWWPKQESSKVKEILKVDNLLEQEKNKQTTY